MEPGEEDAYPLMKDPANREVAAILRHLIDTEREILGMIYFQNLSNPQIGEIRPDPSAGGIIDCPAMP